MKVRVLKPFKDKHSGKIHKKGDTIIISKERYAEILSVAPLVEELKVKKTEKAAD